MPPPAPDDEIALENGIIRIAASRTSGMVVGWTELATGLSLLSAPIGPGIVGPEGDARPDPGGFLATVEENEALLYDPFGHGGIAVQILYRLVPGENAVEAEVALTNRAANPVVVRALRWSGASARLAPAAFVASPDRSGWTVSVGEIGGRATLSYSVRFSAFGELAHAGAEAAYALGESATIRVARPLRSARLFLETEDGRTLEAPVDADPGRALVLPLGGLRPVASMLRSAEGVDLAPRLEEARVEVATSRIPAQDWPALGEPELARLEFDLGLRHLAALERARRATEAGDDARAEECLETALLFNGEDPLTWWAKSGTQRRLDPARERGEWLNARYLRPLEPLVAAEALLAQDAGPPEEEALNPLLRLVAGREAIAAGCVVAYAEAGAFRDAIALGARVLSVQNWRRVRRLMAGLYLTRTRMTMEAAEHHASSLRAETEGIGEPGALERSLDAAVAERFGA